MSNEEQGPMGLDRRNLAAVREAWDRLVEGRENPIKAVLELRRLVGDSASGRLLLAWPDAASAGSATHLTDDELAELISPSPGPPLHYGWAYDEAGDHVWIWPSGEDRAEPHDGSLTRGYAYRRPGGTWRLTTESHDLLPAAAKAVDRVLAAISEREARPATSEEEPTGTKRWTGDALGQASVRLFRGSKIDDLGRFRFNEGAGEAMVAVEFPETQDGLRSGLIESAEIRLSQTGGREFASAVLHLPDARGWFVMTLSRDPEGTLRIRVPDPGDEDDHPAISRLAPGLYEIDVP